MREDEQEESENFIPSCFRAFADIQGDTLKVILKSIEEYRSEILYSRNAVYQLNTFAL